jgi:putative ABC transport system permease protein
MFANYFKIAWRNLYRNKLHSVINIGGLIIGFTIGIGILLVVYGQFSFDNFHKNGKKIYQAYQVCNKAEGEDISPEFGFAAAPAFKAEAPGIDKVTRCADGGNHIEYKGRDLEIPVMMADEDFFTLFTFPVLKGNTGNPLKNLTDVVLSEDAAKKIFGNEDPIGKTIKASAGEKLQAYTVSAVIRNIQNSTIRFDVLTRIENRSNYSQDINNWDNHSHVVYVELKDGFTREQVEKQLKEIDKKYLQHVFRDLVKKGAKPDKSGAVLATRLLPLREVHFSTRVNGHKAVSTLMLMTVLTIGLFIILIACFNFVNINLATAFTRSKEIGVRKCLGAPKGQLFAQLWSESFLVCSIAFLLSLFLVNIFLHSINGIEPIRDSLLPLLLQPGFVGLALTLLLAVSLIAGGYPSWLMAGFKVVETLKGKLNLKRKSILRSSLIVMQFVIACIMISCTFIIYRQFRYLQDADLGIDKDYLISVPLLNTDKGWETIEKLRTRLSANPDILSVTGSNINLGKGLDRRTVQIGISLEHKGRSISTNLASIDYDYAKTLGVKIIAGRDFDRSFGTDTGNNVLVSERFARQFKEKELVGQTVGRDSTWAGWHIIGIFQDFHLYSLEEELQPLTLTLHPHDPLCYCFIKVAPHNLMGAMATIKKEMALLEPGAEFNGSFVDENVRNWYEVERSMSLLFSIAAIVAIILSCTGLLAMVLLIIQQRVKEIGIRKVLGASVQTISLLISRDFLRMICLAVLIAIPIAWLVMSKWLQGFPYRIEIKWWMFALVALSAFVVALGTISINTIRAAMQNPVKSLRSE